MAASRNRQFYTTTEVAEMMNNSCSLDRDGSDIELEVSSTLD